MKKISTKPSGATSYKETAFGIIPRSQLLPLELEGTKRGLEYLSGIIKQGKDVLITPDFICTLHRVSFGWIFPDWAGAFRRIQVSYSGKEAPVFVHVPELILNLCEDEETRMKNLPKSGEERFIVKVVELLAWFQHRYVFIHPFVDYNGRTARMLTILLLLRLKLPPIEIAAETNQDRKRYLAALQRADYGDYFLLENLISSALVESLTKV